MTFSVPVHDGYVLTKSIVRYEVGGELLTDMLQRHLESSEAVRPRYSFKKHIKTFAESGDQPETSEFTIEDLSFPNTTPSFHNFSVREIIRDIKESNFKVSDSPYSDSSFANVPTVSYELPDGKVIELGNERFKIPELLFNNSAPLSNGIVGFSGLHQMVNDSITRCEMDIRKELYGNIVITGGNTLFPGFTDRLTRRLNDIASVRCYVEHEGQAYRLELIHRETLRPVDRRLYSRFVGVFPADVDVKARVHGTRRWNS